MAIEMEVMHEEVRVMHAAFLVMIQRRFCHGNYIYKKSINGFHYAAYNDPTKRHLATIASYHPKYHDGIHNAISAMAANVIILTNSVLCSQRGEEKDKGKEMEKRQGIRTW